MTSWEIPCEVIAPSLIPKKPGDRRKTDKRDAEKLAGLYRSGQLTPVHVPTEAEERVRSVTRARQAVRGEIHVSKQQVLKHLQRIGHVFHEGKAWTRDFRAWLAALELDPLDRKVIGFHLLLLEQKEAVLKELDATIEEIAKQESYCAVVGRLRCLRGIDTLTALCLVAEIGDARRFASPRRLMGYLGLSITEDSSGETERRGGITKAGNHRARRILVECSWSYRHPPRVGKKKLAKVEAAPPAVQEIAWKAQARLAARYRALARRGKRPTLVVTAIARELSGFLWAVSRAVGAPATPTK
jgi:transposase